jgi:hypothetical protein
MGMRIKRALQIRDAGISALRSVYDHARHFGQTSEAMETARHEALGRIGIGKTPTPQWVRSYLEGYWRHIVDEAYRRDLVYGGMVEGKFYSTHSDRADYYEKNGIAPSDYADDGRVQLRGHYWKPYAEMAHRPEPKPFFVG